MKKNIEKSVLFVVPYNPIVGSSGPQGPKNVTQALVRLVSSVYNVTLIVIVNDATLTQERLQFMFPEVRRAYICKPIGGWTKSLWRFRFVLKGLPASLADAVSDEFVPLLNEEIQKNDTVHFEYFTLAPYLRHVTAFKPLALHCHDAYSLYQMRCREASVGLIDKLKTHVRFVLFKNLELKLIATADAALTVSPVDSQYLTNAGLANVRHLAPVVAAPVARSPGLGRQRLPVELLCVVPATYQEFQLGEIRAFFHTVLPMLNERFPGKVRLTLFGKTASRLLAELPPHPGAEAIDFVDDYFGFLTSRNWIYLYPQKVGAGLHTKVLDAMAVEIPVVGYAAILDAFCGVSGEHYIACDNSGELVNAVGSLLESGTLRQKMASSGRLLLESRFSTTRVTQDLEEIYDSIDRCNA